MGRVGQLQPLRLFVLGPPGACRCEELLEKGKLEKKRLGLYIDENSAWFLQKEQAGGSFAAVRWGFCSLRCSPAPLLWMFWFQPRCPQPPGPSPCRMVALGHPRPAQGLVLGVGRGFCPKLSPRTASSACVGRRETTVPVSPTRVPPRSLLLCAGVPLSVCPSCSVLDTQGGTAGTKHAPGDGLGAPSGWLRAALLQFRSEPAACRSALSVAEASGLCSERRGATP